MFTLNNRISKFDIIVTTAITVIAILTLGMVTFSSAPAADHSYDAVEQIHAARSFASAATSFAYDQVEAVRLLRGGNDQRYDALEQLRGSRGVSADRSYDQIEALRTLNIAAASASAAGYDLVEQVRLARGMGADHSYDAIEEIRLQR